MIGLFARLFCAFNIICVVIYNKLLNNNYLSNLQIELIEHYTHQQFDNYELVLLTKQKNTKTITHQFHFNQLTDLTRGLGNLLEKIITQQKHSTFFKKINYQIPISIYLALDRVYKTSVKLPQTYQERDILDYLEQEQASLFPQATGELVMDFYQEAISEPDEHNKQCCSVTVYALDKLYYQELLSSIKKFPVKCVFFGRESNINFLPWRQQAKRLARKRWLLKLVLIVLLLISILFINFRLITQKINHNSDQLQSLSQKTAGYDHELDQLITLKNQYLAQLVFAQKNQLEKNKLAGVLCALEAINQYRPYQLFITQIDWRQGVMLLTGRAHDLPLIKTYRQQLVRQCQIKQVVLKNLQASQDKDYPQAFVLEFSW